LTEKNALAGFAPPYT